VGGKATPPANLVYANLEARLLFTNPKNFKFLSKFRVFLLFFDIFEAFPFALFNF
jgi:hypothetical protein